MGVVEAAANLFDLLATYDTDFTQHLQPGLSRVAIHALVDPTGVVLPEEALQFYEHYSLPKGYQYIPKYADGRGQPTFYGIYWMLGLEDAVEPDQLSWFRENYVVEDEFYPGEYEGAAGWVPFLQEDASFYLLDTIHASSGLCPIIRMPRDFGPEIVFVSMTAMFETMHDWIKEGVLAVEDGHLVGEHKGDPVSVGQIAERHNPGIEAWKRKASGRVSIYEVGG